MIPWIINHIMITRTKTGFPLSGSLGSPSLKPVPENPQMNKEESTAGTEELGVFINKKIEDSTFK